MELLFASVMAQTTDAMNVTLEGEPKEMTLSVWELIMKSGLGGQIIIFALFLLSVVAVYIFFERFMTIRKASKEDLNFMNNIKDYIHDSKLDAARALCKNANTPIARLIDKGVSRIGRPLNDISTAIENEGKLETYLLEKNLATLATISGAAPMIGFLGTVIGMVVAFHKMASAGGQIDVEMLSTGIYTAMTTTVAGLIVGILAYMAYNILVSNVEKVVYKMEAKTTEFLDLLQEPA